MVSLHFSGLNVGGLSCLVGKKAFSSIICCSLNGEMLSSSDYSFFFFFCGFEVHLQLLLLKGSSLIPQYCTWLEMPLIGARLDGGTRFQPSSLIVCQL